MAAAYEKLKWTFGLINCANKYLTAEAFQGKVNANGTTLKKKQIWTLERVTEGEIALKSHSGKYLTSNKDGQISANAESVGPDEKFVLLTQDDGKVAIQSAVHKRFIGGTGDQLSGFIKEISKTELWTLHLAVHPQINLFNVNRRAYCHLAGDEIQCNEQIPWGADAMLILEFHSGKYAIRAANSKLLNRTGTLVDQITDNCLYTLVFRDAQVAFRDCNGKYLTAVGAQAIVQSRKDTIGKDELFIMEDSQPQVTLLASNGKYVSIRGRLEVRADQATITDSEMFQLEAIDRTDRSGNVKWAIRGQNKKYWNSGGTIIADQDSFTKDTTQFEVVWMGPLIALKASNSKYISAKSNGQLAANSAEITDACKFVFEFTNRPIVVLRGGFGFVGVKGGSGILECNRSVYDVFGMKGSAGTYQFVAENGKYWKVEQDLGVTVTSDTPVDFYLELRAHTHMCIVAPNGKYLKGVQNGGFTASGTTVDASTLWEY